MAWWDQLAEGRCLTLRALVDLSSPGELIGPIEIEGWYCLFQVEQFLPASLEGQVKQELQNQLFEKWLEENAKAHYQAAGEFMIVNDALLNLAWDVLPLVCWVRNSKLNSKSMRLIAHPGEIIWATIHALLPIPEVSFWWLRGGATGTRARWVRNFEERWLVRRSARTFRAWLELLARCSCSALECKAVEESCLTRH